MSKESLLIDAVRRFALEILENKIPENIKYHSVEHTQEVVDACCEIGQNSGLSDEEMEVLELAAWFHDIGYRDVIKNHEAVSAQIALAFLGEKNYDDVKAAQVAGCIMATQMPQTPKSKLEEIICDADLLHLATDNYFRKATLLHEELEKTTGKKISEQQWMDMNKTFIKQHEYFTDYAKSKYGPTEDLNLKKVKKKLKAMKKGEQVKQLEEEVAKLKEKVKKSKDNTPTRGIETMFRLTSKNHLELSGMADNKANIMISVNSIILSVIVSVLIRKLEEYPHLTIPALIMTSVCLGTIIFAILATRPNVSKGVFTEEDIVSKKTNLLFFGNFHKMKREQYEWGMKEMMKDADYLYTSLIRDIYFLGVVLGKKYRMLRIAYTIFMFGLIISVIAFLIAQKFFAAPTPY